MSSEFHDAEYGPEFKPMQRTSPLRRELAEFVAEMEARIRGEALVIVRASREQAEREYQAGLKLVREGAPVRVGRRTIRP